MALALTIYAAFMATLAFGLAAASLGWLLLNWRTEKALAAERAKLYPPVALTPTQYVYDLPPGVAENLSTEETANLEKALQRQRALEADEDEWQDNFGDMDGA